MTRKLPLLAALLLSLGVVTTTACDVPDDLDEAALAELEADDLDELMTDDEAREDEARRDLATAPDDPAAVYSFFPPYKPYTRDTNPFWKMPNGVVLIYDAGDNTRFDYVMQYDYTRLRVTNMVRVHFSDVMHMRAALNAPGILTRPVVDMSEYGTQFPIKTPAPPPPPAGQPWPTEFEHQVQVTADHFY